MAGVLYFQHNVPSVGVNTLATTCSSVTPNPTSVPAGVNGFVLFTCAGAPAFTSLVGQNQVVPTFSLATGYTAPLTIVIHGTQAPWDGTPGATCNGQSTNIFSGQPIVLPQNSYDYCANENGPAGGLASWTITWGT